MNLERHNNVIINRQIKFILLNNEIFYPSQRWGVFGPLNGPKVKSILLSRNNHWVYYHTTDNLEVLHHLLQELRKNA